MSPEKRKRMDTNIEIPKPERLIPHPIGGNPPEILEAHEQGISDREEFASIRQDALRRAPDLDDVLRDERQKNGIETSPNVNLGLDAIEDFQRIAHEAQDFRKIIKDAKDPDEKAKALTVYGQKRSELAEYLKYGLSFEKAYREYIKSRGSYFTFLSSVNEVSQLEGLLSEPSFKSMSGDSLLDAHAQARVEIVMRDTEAGHLTSKKRKEQSLDALKTIYPEDSEEFRQLVEQINNQNKKRPKPLQTKRQVQEKLDDLRSELHDLWGDSMVRYFWQRAEIDGFLDDFAKGKDVVETQGVIKKLNELNDWENHHPRTTIGGIMVGPPGVGKTTMIRHYLEAKGRNFVYIDLSEDVTRYLLYGSKSIEFKSPSEYYKALVDDLSKLEGDELVAFVRQNAHVLQNAFGMKDDEAVATEVDLIESTLSSAERESEEPSKINELKQKIVGMAKGAFYNELGTEFAHIVKKNGWRDGVVISALRRGDSIIFDEFNKNKNWSLIYGLLTAKPGEDWYFADNDEHIQIPSKWRMYFTANIGRKHGGFEIAEALASRAAGKVMDVDYPASPEEMYIALCALSNPEGDFLRGKDDLAKLFVTVHELFPKIRKFLEDSRQTIPISYRTIRDLGEKMVLYQDPKSKRPVYQPTTKSFDESLYEVLVESYALYEDKTIPKEIVNLATSVGLMLDNSVQARVEGWIGEDEFKKRKETFEAHKDDYAEIVKKIRGLSIDTSDLLQPIPRSF